MANSTDDAFIQSCIAIFERPIKIVVGIPSDIYLISHILVIALNSFLIIPTILLNAVSVAAITKSTRLRSKPCYFLVLIQSLVDLFVGAVGIPVYIFFIVSQILGFRDCTTSLVIQQFTFLPSGISIITLSAMAIERYIGVLHPYAYSTRVTKGRILVYELLGCLFIIAFIVVSLPIPNVLSIFVVFLIITFVILNTLVYTRIYFVVLKIARLNKAQDVNARTQNSNKRQTFLNEVKQAKSCFLVLLCFFICFLPLPLSTLILREKNFNYMVSQVWCCTLIILNSSVNSIIFFWTKKELRIQALQVLRRSTTVTPRSRP